MAIHSVTEWIAIVGYQISGDQGLDFERKANFSV